MYINNNMSGRFSRTFHRLFCVLSASTVLFVLSSCRKSDTASVEDMPFSDTETVSASVHVPDAAYHDEISSETMNKADAYDEAAAEHESASDIATEVTHDTSDTNTSEPTNENLDEFTSETTHESLKETTSETTTEIMSNASNENTTANAPENITASAMLNLENLERINSTYGINIRYGSSVVWDYGTSGAGLTDDNLIASRLALLEDCLKQYPLSFFSDLNAYSPITINLIDTLDGADGYTDGRNGEALQIALSCDNPDLYFTLAFHHELFHFIEYCIKYNFENADEILNTDQFTDITLYGTNDYTGTIYSFDADIYNQYFTSIYAKTNRLEDRAELFSFYMGNTTKECMRHSDTPITLKMKKLADAIRLCCSSLSEYEPGSLPWEGKIAY